MAHPRLPGTGWTDRRQALREPDAVIERAECTRTRYPVRVEELAAAGAGTSAAAAEPTVRGSQPRRPFVRPSGRARRAGNRTVAQVPPPAGATSSSPSSCRANSRTSRCP